MLPRPTHCTECGADFARAGAIQTVMATKDWKLALVGGALMVGVLALALSLSLGLGASLLPTPVLLTLAPYSGGSQMMRELETRTLTAKERADFVRLQIAHAAPSSSFMSSRPSPRLQSNMLLPAVTAGDLPESAIDDALRTIVRLDATIRQTSDGAQFVLTPTFGSDLFDRAGDVWVVFRGVAFVDNSAAALGGALYLSRAQYPTATTELTLAGCAFQGNAIAPDPTAPTAAGTGSTRRTQW
jgi:hypothetical protein